MTLPFEKLDGGLPATSTRHCIQNSEPDCNRRWRRARKSAFCLDRFTRVYSDVGCSILSRHTVVPILLPQLFAPFRVVSQVRSSHQLQMQSAKKTSIGQRTYPSREGRREWWSLYFVSTGIRASSARAQLPARPVVHLLELKYCRHVSFIHAIYHQPICQNPHVFDSAMKGV